MGLFKFFLLLAVIIDLSQAMDTNITSQVDDVKEINKILDQEKTKPGSFIKSIIADLKQCSNQKMLFLNYLTIKSAYWWDAMPKNRMHDQTDDLEIQKYKDFLIDRKFRSSIYDREGPKHNMPLANLLFKSSGISYNELVNSWQSASQKIKFYEQKDIGSRKGTIEEILDYGYPFNVSLDTYPSVYQIMKAAKLLKYQKQQGESPIEKCYLPLQEIEKKSPPQIILDTLKALFQKPFYQKFSKQNHPISRIVQDHLLKLHHKAQTQYFPEDVMGKDSDDNKTTYSRSLLFHKVLSNIEKMIRYMSTFDIDINKGICEVKGLNVNNVINDPYYLYAQFYEITNDLLFTLMYTEFGYGRNDFDRIFSRTYINRIPILQKLHGVGNIVIQSFPMRSGMDAFVNASMSIDHMPYPISIAPKVSGLDNTVYYEINRLLTLLKPPPNIKTYISLNKEIKLDDIKLIKDDFIINYISNNIENLKFIHEQDMIDKNKETLEKFIKTFTENPFTEMSGWYYYDEKLPKPAKSDIVLKIIDEIRKTTVYAHLFEIKEYKGKYFLIVPRALENQSQLFKNVQRKYTLIESIFSIDNHPSFVAGTTTETIDQSHDPNYIDHLFNKIKNIFMAKELQFPSESPFTILWDTTLEINQGPCYAMIEKFQEEIKAGKIIFILFKSLQKYASLGIGKTKAGVATIIGEKIACEPSSQKLNQYASDVWSHHALEFMTMLFYYDRFKDRKTLQTVEGLQDNEVFYYQAVSSHAKRIYQQNPHYSLAGGCLFLKDGPQNLPYSDTFGFAIPTNIEVEGLTRYSVGLNPKGLR